MSRLLLAAFGAFTIANLIHNDFGFDPVIIPAALLVGFYCWRPRQALLLAAALAVLSVLASVVFRQRAASNS